MKSDLFRILNATGLGYKSSRALFVILRAQRPVSRMRAVVVLLQQPLLGMLGCRIRVTMEAMEVLAPWDWVTSRLAPGTRRKGMHRV